MLFLPDSMVCGIGASLNGTKVQSGGSLGWTCIGTAGFRDCLASRSRVAILPAICAECQAQGAPVKWVFTIEKARKKISAGCEAMIEKST